MSDATPDTTGKKQAALWAALCARHGMTHAVISPGSRNAPLIMAFARQPGLECLSVPDERSAAYFALGLARATGRPVALICTSGTAALNYLPALAEAWHQRVPLMALTADRPAEWIGHNDGQTIRQRGMYGHFVAYEAQLPEALRTPGERDAVSRAFREAWRTLTTMRRPVHINCPFDEPLYETAPAGEPAEAARTVEAGAPPSAPPPAIEWPAGAARVMILAGARDNDPRLRAAWHRLAATGRVALVAECAANLDAADAVWMADPLAAALPHRPDLTPDLLVSFGDMVLSKGLKQWLRAHPPRRHWIVTDETPPPDTFRGIARAWNTPPAAFLDALLPHAAAMDPAYAEAWNLFGRDGAGRLRRAIEEGPWCDAQAFAQLGAALPRGSAVVLGNSTPIRYAQMVAWPVDAVFYANRGVSGIDGVSSTAAGLAWGIEREVTLIVGDVAFQYDLNALWHRHLRGTLRVIVMHNGGGNLFRLIPGPRATGLSDPYFETPQVPRVEALCQAFELNYARADSLDTLRAALEEPAARPGRPRVLEVFTDPDVNQEQWQRLMRLSGEMGIVQAADSP